MFCWVQNIQVTMHKREASFGLNKDAGRVGRSFKKNIYIYISVPWLRAAKAQARGYGARVASGSNRLKSNLLSMAHLGAALWQGPDEDEAVMWGWAVWLLPPPRPHNPTPTRLFQSTGCLKVSHPEQPGSGSKNSSPTGPQARPRGGKSSFREHESFLIIQGCKKHTAAQTHEERESIIWLRT